MLYRPKCSNATLKNIGFDFENSHNVDLLCNCLFQSVRFIPKIRKMIKFVSLSAKDRDTTLYISIKVRGNTDIARSLLKQENAKYSSTSNTKLRTLFRYFHLGSEQELKATRVLGRIAWPLAFAFSKSANIPLDLEELDYFRNYTNFTVSNYLYAKGWQFKDNVDVFFCR